MKGVILAGGLGTRLYPCTLVVNKHLLPIYDKPMIFYPIEALVKADCKELLIISGQSIGDIAKLIGNGEKFGLKSVLYAYQDQPDGISGALKLAESFVGKEKFCVILGDNLFFDDLKIHIEEFKLQPFNTCKLFIKNIDNPISFGVAEIQNEKIIDIIEKPIIPKTNHAVIGIYMYDYHVFDIIRNLKISNRNEYEITDVNMYYVRNNNAYYAFLQSEWLDTGSINSMYKANKIIRNMRKIQNLI